MEETATREDAPLTDVVSGAFRVLSRSGLAPR